MGVMDMEGRWGRVNVGGGGGGEVLGMVKLVLGVGGGGGGEVSGW